MAGRRTAMIFGLIRRKPQMSKRVRHGVRSTPRERVRSSTWEPRLVSLAVLLLGCPGDAEQGILGPEETCDPQPISGCYMSGSPRPAAPAPASYGRQEACKS